MIFWTATTMGAACECSEGEGKETWTKIMASGKGKGFQDS